VRADPDGKTGGRGRGVGEGSGGVAVDGSGVGGHVYCLLFWFWVGGVIRVMKMMWMRRVDGWLGAAREGLLSSEAVVQGCDLTIVNEILLSCAWKMLYGRRCHGRPWPSSSVHPNLEELLVTLVPIIGFSRATRSHSAFLNSFSPLLFASFRCFELTLCAQIGLAWSDACKRLHALDHALYLHDLVTPESRSHLVNC
jgi:hypothetical protein